MELGPIQKKWLQELREHPERKYTRKLGIQYPSGEQKLCCLAQLAVTAQENGIATNLEWVGSDTSILTLQCDHTQETLSRQVADVLGLRAGNGALHKDYKDKETGKSSYSLGYLNDYFMTWPEIADYVEANPDNVFTKSY